MEGEDGPSSPAPCDTPVRQRDPSAPLGAPWPSRPLLSSLPALISLDLASTGSTGGNHPPPTFAGIFCPRTAPGAQRGDGPGTAGPGLPPAASPPPGEGRGARAELGMEVFNYTIKCTIRCNYQRSEGATVHNGLVIYRRRCLYCSAPLPNDYGKLSHLHGCHGNGGLAGARGGRGEPLTALSPPAPPHGLGVMGVAAPGVLWGHGGMRILRG